MKTFKKIKSFACRAVAAVALIVVAALGCYGVAYLAVKLMLLAGISMTAALALLGAGGIAAGLSSGWFLSRYPSTAAAIYNWVHNFTHWNDEIYIVA
jgi:hypothetical protein